MGARCVIGAMACVCALSALPAAAQTRWYAGLGGGWTRTSDNLGRNLQQAVGAAEGRDDTDERAGTWKVFGGVRLASWLAVEAAYADLGKMTLRSEMMAGIPPLPAVVTLRRKLDAIGVDALLVLPWQARGLELYGKAGAYRARLQVDAELGGNIDFIDGPERRRQASRRETTPHYGLGVQWRASPRVAVRFDVERFRSVGTAFAPGRSDGTGEADVDTASLSVLATF